MAITKGPRNKFDQNGNFIGTEEIDLVVCDKTKIALNDGVCIYPGYVEVTDHGYYVYRSDDPNNSMDTNNPSFPTPERFKEWLEVDKGLKNRIAYLVKEGPFPNPEGAEPGTHFISLNALNHWCADKLANLPEEEVPTPEDLEIAVTDFAEAVLPDASTPLVEGTEPPVVDLSNESPLTAPIPEGAPSLPEETAPTVPDQLPAQEETPIPSQTPSDTSQVDQPEVPTAPAGDGQSPPAREEAQPEVSTSPDEGIIVPDVPVPDEIARCPICGFGSSSPEALNAHIALHETQPEPETSTPTTETATPPVQAPEVTPPAQTPPVQTETAKVPCVTCDAGFASVPHACPNAS